MLHHLLHGRSLVGFFLKAFPAEVNTRNRDTPDFEWSTLEFLLNDLFLLVCVVLPFNDVILPWKQVVANCTEAPDIDFKVVRNFVAKLWGPIQKFADLLAVFDCRAGIHYSSFVELANSWDCRIRLVCHYNTFKVQLADNNAVVMHEFDCLSYSVADVSGTFFLHLVLAST